MRLARRSVVFVFLALIGPTVVGGCARSRHTTAFCASVQRGRPVFDPVIKPDLQRVLHAFDVFDQIAASAPAAVAPDLRTIGAYQRSYFRDPASVAADSAALERYQAAVARVDRYLQDTCGLTVPTRATSSL